MVLLLVLLLVEEHVGLAAGHIFLTHSSHPRIIAAVPGASRLRTLGFEVGRLGGRFEGGSQRTARRGPHEVRQLGFLVQVFTKADYAHYKSV